VETEPGSSSLPLAAPSDEASKSEGVAPFVPAEADPQEAHKTKPVIEDDDDDF
jgi:hypothetical protein